jgi:uncharacterized cupredoxin-like copper-binding protein
MRTRSLVIAAAVVLTVAGCSTSSAAQTPKALTATLSEFKIDADSTKLAAGDLTFTVANKGTVTHEFVIMKTDLKADALPKTADGKVDEEGEGISPVDEVENIAAGTSGSLKVNLEPGNYVFLCNLPGHYLGGMHGSFTVVAG